MSRAAIIAITARKGPMTKKQLEFELSLHRSTVSTIINRARKHGTQHIRIAAWAGDVPKYGPGPGEDAPGGSTRDRILALLDEHDGMSTPQLAEALGISAVAVDAAIRRMRKVHGTLHIIRWKRWTGEKGGKPSPVWAAGRGKDAPPPVIENAQREAEIRYRQRARVRRVLEGGALRPRKSAGGPVAGPFDGLMR